MCNYQELRTFFCAFKFSLIRENFLVVMILGVTSIPLSGAEGGSQTDFPTYVLPNAQVNSLDPSDKADALLLDSILSIVQTYYVDAERISPEKLVNLTLNTLEMDPMVKLRREGDSKLEVTLNKSTKKINLKQPLNYDSYLKFVLDLKSVLKPAFRDMDQQPIQYLSNLLLKSLDAHSSLLSSEEYNELREGTEGTFGGLGILVGIRDEVLTVIKPLPNSPAIRTGVLKNDKILSINGLKTFGYSLDNLVEHMRGAPGTVVDLEILSDVGLSARSLKMKREVIKVNSVIASELVTKEGAILRMTVESFSSRTTREIVEKLALFQKKYRTNNLGYILDLRSNPGGLLDQAVQVSDLFLDKGVIVHTKGRRSEVEYADKGYDELESPLIVLVNEDSASASEIVAGALQDHGRAIVLGQQSYGKGSVQTVFELPGFRALKLTIARYYTPLSRSIQNVGITPDIHLLPVTQRDENLNLLGIYRYKSEQFLHNHLNARLLGANANDILQSPSVLFKGAFLRKEDLPPIDERVSDTEIDMARNLLVEISRRKAEMVAESPSYNRASFWMSTIGPYISKYVQDLTLSANNSIKNKHEFSWISDVHNCHEDLKLTNLQYPKDNWKAGQKVTFDYQIENKGSQPCSGLTVFLRSDNSELPTTEFLIPEVSPRTKRNGKLTYKVPTYKEPEEVFLSLGISQMGSAVSSSFLPIKARVRSSRKGALSAIASLRDEIGGNKNRKLEPNEKASLVINLKNISEHPVENLSIEAINISGRQVDIKAEMRKLTAIGVNQSKSVAFPIEASKFLASQVIQVGVVVKSDDLKWPHKEVIEVMSSPAAIANSSITH